MPMLTADGCQERRNRLIKEMNTDLIIITNPRNLYYYAGFLAPFPSLAEWGPAFLVIDVKNGDNALICHNFATDAAERSYAEISNIWNWHNATRNCGAEIYSKGAEILGSFIHSTSKSTSIGIERGFFPLIADIGSIEFTDITPYISSQRRQKDPDEIACIRYALDAALAGHEAARREMRPGMTELDLFILMNAAMTKKAGFPVKMIGDIISGPRTLEISGCPTNRIIEKNDTIILDLNPVVGAYRADYTATIVLNPNPDKKVKDLEMALHTAIEVGEKLLWPGKKGREIHHAVKCCLDGMGFEKGFVHHAGHGLGLGHPEPPYFVSESDEELVVGDVVTLEPGLYAPGCSGRIEHVYLITADGPERLTHHDTKFRL